MASFLGFLSRVRTVSDCLGLMTDGAAHVDLTRQLIPRKSHSPRARLLSSLASWEQPISHQLRSLLRRGATPRLKYMLWRHGASRKHRRLQRNTRSRRCMEDRTLTKVRHWMHESHIYINVIVLSRIVGRPGSCRGVQPGKLTRSRSCGVCAHSESCLSCRMGSTMSGL